MTHHRMIRSDRDLGPAREQMPASTEEVIRDLAVMFVEFEHIVCTSWSVEDETDAERESAPRNMCGEDGCTGHGAAESTWDMS